MSEEKTTYKGFSVGDRVYYYKKGCCPSLPSCLIGAILKIQTGKESATFVVHDERDNIVDVPYEHIFKNQQLCFAYAASLTELECWRLQGYSDDDFYAAESTCQVEREKMNRTLYHQAGNSIPVVIFEAMFKAMFEQGIIEVGS